jgi:hypothetical protein
MKKYEDKDLQKAVDDFIKERNAIIEKHSKKENIFKRFLKKVLTF